MPASELDGMIEAIRERCDKATEGPWDCFNGPTPVDEDDLRWQVDTNLPQSKYQHTVAVIENGAPGDTLETERATAEFIAHARTDVPRLLAWGTAMQDALKEMQTLRYELCPGVARKALSLAAKALRGKPEEVPNGD